MLLRFLGAKVTLRPCLVSKLVLVGLFCLSTSDVCCVYISRMQYLEIPVMLIHFISTNTIQVLFSSSDTHEDASPLLGLNINDSPEAAWKRVPNAIPRVNPQDYSMRYKSMRT